MSERVFAGNHSLSVNTWVNLSIHDEMWLKFAKIWKVKSSITDGLIIKFRLEGELMQFWVMDFHCPLCLTSLLGAHNFQSLTTGRMWICESCARSRERPSCLCIVGMETGPSVHVLTQPKHISEGGPQTGGRRARCAYWGPLLLKLENWWWFWVRLSTSCSKFLVWGSLVCHLRSSATSTAALLRASWPDVWLSGMAAPLLWIANTCREW